MDLPAKPLDVSKALDRRQGPALATHGGIEFLEAVEDLQRPAILEVSLHVGHDTHSSG